jgi:Tol biopolymer transport system component
MTRLRVVLFTALFLLLSVPNRLDAQFFTFGKNRVQYHNYEWRYIESQHFDVLYYSANNYKLGEFAAQSLEAAYKQISEDFKHEIAERITIIIYDSEIDFAQTNVVALPDDSQGILGVTDLYKNRVTVWFTGDYRSFKHTLHHELVHAVINDMFYGGSLQSVIQNNIQLVIPLWFNEGVCEFSSVGFDTNTDNFMRDAVINNYVPPIMALDGYFAYRGGQTVWAYIAETYGREKIAEIFQRIKTSRNLDIGFRQAIGLSIDELSDRWQDWLRKRYYPEVANRELLSDAATKITSYEKTGYYNTSPAISPQGDKIAMISSKTGYFDLIVVSAINGRVIKRLIKGDNNLDFEALNILNPNLSWSPDGRQLAISSQNKGYDHLAIINYVTGRSKKVRFKDMDAILSVAWSPDGKRIAFSGTIGAYSDIFVYNLEQKTLQNLTNDLFSDLEPSWSPDGRTIYFSSDRGPNAEAGRFRDGYNMLINPDLHQKDVYSIDVESRKMTRITQTPEWDETRPLLTASGKLVFISDQNGIPNVYEFDLRTRQVFPLTNLISGVQQMSITPDGTKLAINCFNKGQLDVFMVRSPFSNRKDKPLEPNIWAKRRSAEEEYQRVPAVRYSFEMFAPPLLAANYLNEIPKTNAQKKVEEALKKVEQEVEEAEENSGLIDFRNYQFGENLDKEAQKVIETNVFEPKNNMVEDGRFRPRPYRLKFSPDIRYFEGMYSTAFGAFGFTELVFSDVLGNHQLVFASNLVSDLRSANYSISYANFTNRWNYIFSWFHQAQQYQTLSFGNNAQLVRFRTYGGSVSADYPVNKFSRVTLNSTVLTVSRDLSAFGTGGTTSLNATFALPSITYTTDRTMPGFYTPSGGHRWAVSLNGSPPLTQNTIRFASLLGDYRKYIGNPYSPYSLAFRAAGGTSAGRDKQTFFLGGMMNWINQRWEEGDIPIDRLEDTFFTMPALPMRGHYYNALYGSNFMLTNWEFRFPLVAALLPGPIPILPLYNLQGVFFADVGAAWGLDIRYSTATSTSQVVPIQFYNPAKLNFGISKAATVYWNIENPEEQILPGEPLPDLEETVMINGVPYPKWVPKRVRQNDVLIGMGYGLRTVLLGLPFRFDVGWPYDGESFGDPVYYFTLGLDF